MTYNRDVYRWRALLDEARRRGIDRIGMTYTELERLMTDTHLPLDLRDPEPKPDARILVPGGTEETGYDKITSDLAANLEGWWREQARDEVERVVPKAVQYGGAGRATDLIDIGTDILRLRGQTDVTDEEATEAGIYFYLRGKVGRWTSAMLNGERVSDDTLHDISVYCRMAQRNRAVGGWPF